MPALGAVEVQRHPFLTGSREEHGLVVLAGRAARVASARQCRVGADVSKHDGALAGRVSDLGAVDAPLGGRGVLLVAAVAADEDQDLGLVFWVDGVGGGGRGRRRRKEEVEKKKKNRRRRSSSSFSLLSISHLAFPVLLRVEEVVRFGAEAEFGARGRRSGGCRGHLRKREREIEQDRPNGMECDALWVLCFFFAC